MKKLFLMVGILLVAGATMFGQSKKTLTVDNMHCGGCANNVKQLIGKVDGVEMVTVDLAKKEVTVEYNEKKTTPCKIVASLKDSKYKVVKVDGKEVAEKKECCKKGEENKECCKKK